MFHVRPAVPFTEFNEGFEFQSQANIMRNLMQYCGYFTLHQDCWLYKWLQEKIKCLKFSGAEEFRKWCTYPEWYKFHQKMRPDRMTLTPPQMERWKKYLGLWKEEIRENCSGPTWRSYYEPDRKQ